MEDFWQGFHGNEIMGESEDTLWLFNIAMENGDFPWLC
jgi:hypothetical protein